MVSKSISERFLFESISILNSIAEVDVILSSLKDNVRLLKVKGGGGKTLKFWTSR